MPNSFAIREATQKDTDAVAKIHIKTWQFMYKGILPQTFLMSLSLEQRKRLRQDYLANPNPKIKHYVAILNQQIAGFCDVGPSRDQDVDDDVVAEIYALYVDPSFLRNKIGQNLLNQSLQFAKRAGFSQATTWVLTQNQIGRSFYEKQGFAIEGKTRQTTDHGVTYEEMRYYKSL